MSSLDLSQVGVHPDLPNTPDTSPEQQHAAALAVCAHATDVWPHCRHCDDECTRTHYDPCPCQEDGAPADTQAP